MSSSPATPAPVNHAPTATPAAPAPTRPAANSAASQLAAAVASARPATPRPATPKPQAARPAAPAAPAPPARTAPAAVPASPWADFFRKWPEGIPQRGIVISQQGETTPFRGFMLRGELLLFERISPDSLGARFLALTFGEVAGVKFTDPLKQEVFEAAGFTGNLSS